MLQSSLMLSLTWVVLGTLVGALGLGARLGPAAWGPRGRLVLLAVGAVAALAGGWLGALLLGRFFGTMAALWIAVAAVVLLPLIASRVRRTAQPPTTQPS
jgi:hypothetical protein